jgi:hypothetical protein
MYGPQAATASLKKRLHMARPDFSKIPLDKDLLNHQQAERSPAMGNAGKNHRQSSIFSKRYG